MRLRSSQADFLLLGGGKWTKAGRVLIFMTDGTSHLDHLIGGSEHFLFFIIFPFFPYIGNNTPN